MTDDRPLADRLIGGEDEAARLRRVAHLRRVVMVWLLVAVGGFAGAALIAAFLSASQTSPDGLELLGIALGWTGFTAVIGVSILTAQLCRAMGDRPLISFLCGFGAFFMIYLIGLFAFFAAYRRSNRQLREAGVEPTLWRPEPTDAFETDLRTRLASDDAEAGEGNAAAR